LRLDNIWERDSDPSSGILKDDLTWILGLQYFDANSKQG
jgi:hypothetical protein